MRGLQRCCLGQYFIFWLICWVLLSEMVLQCQVTATPSNHAIKHPDMETASEVAKRTTVGHHVIRKPHINKSRYCGTEKTESSGTTDCMKNGKPKKKTIVRRASGTNNTKPSNSSSTEHPSLISPLLLPTQSSSPLPSPTTAKINPSVTTDPSTTQDSPSTTTDSSTTQDSPSTTTDPSTTQYSPSTTTTTTPTALSAAANSSHEKNSVVQAIPGQTIECESGMPYVIASLIGFMAVFLLINGLLSWWSIKNKLRQQQIDEFQEYNVDQMMLP